MLIRFLVCFVFAVAIASVDCNSEGDALISWKLKLVDPNGVLQSWDPTLVNPCTWDLGNAGLSGPLVPQLGTLANLQYLEVFGNNLTGTIPTAIANLTKLVSLDLYQNQFNGAIPESLGNLVSLSFLRLNSNKFSGILPVKVIQLVRYGNLRILNVSENQLAGTVHRKTTSGFAVTKIIQDPRAQK
ncbi:hypothetical protein RGQ29_015158 [Quercus rubra]|uniref:Leucine-rich repeat-containing N-terminal plant-type domain-containing protein n=1 Tax=Quercus rubra TaxID=3512 RepID=A0AAN7FNJ9_QUERU|nr:hypothetical protein RGQ29_015158 [Quercus rubra]